MDTAEQHEVQICRKLSKSKKEVVSGQPLDSSLYSSYVAAQSEDNWGRGLKIGALAVRLGLQQQGNESLLAVGVV